MNKRQKKKLYKKLHGYNPPKCQGRKNRNLPMIQPKEEPVLSPNLDEAVKRIGQGILQGWGMVVGAVAKVFKGLGEQCIATGNGLDKIARNYQGIAVQASEPELAYVTVAKELAKQRAAGKRRKRIAQAGRKRRNGRN